jgi:hypothetical protein
MRPGFADPYTQYVIGLEELRNLKERAASEEEYVAIYETEGEFLAELVNLDALGYNDMEEPHDISIF